MNLAARTLRSLASCGLALVMSVSAFGQSNTLNSLTQGEPVVAYTTGTSGAGIQPPGNPQDCLLGRAPTLRGGSPYRCPKTYAAPWSRLPSTACPPAPITAIIGTSPTESPNESPACPSKEVTEILGLEVFTQPPTGWR